MGGAGLFGEALFSYTPVTGEGEGGKGIKQCVWV